MVQQKLNSIRYDIQELTLLYSTNKHEEFVLYFIQTPNLDYIIQIGLRGYVSDLVDMCREVLYWLNSIYYEYRLKLDKKTNYVCVNFTLRNSYDMALFAVVLNKLIYLYTRSTCDFCKMFENLPKCIFDKIDDLRETSFKSRDSKLFEGFLQKCKFISFEYFNKLKNYDLHEY